MYLMGTGDHEDKRGDVREPALEGLSVAELLAGYARSLVELRRRGVVRSGNAPAGDYGEWLVAKALGGVLADNFSAKSWDVCLPDGARVQVKTRLVSMPPKAGQRQTSTFRSWNFDSAAFVLLHADDYSVYRAALVPVGVVEEAARWRAYVNGSVVMMTPSLLEHPAARNIARALRAAAEGTASDP